MIFTVCTLNIWSHGKSGGIEMELGALEVSIPYIPGSSS